jgi:hypothetical protein
MKEEIEHLLEYLWDEEENYYSLCLFEEYGDEEDSPFLWFENADFGDREVLQKILNEDYCSGHIFLTLVALKLKNDTINYTN